MARGRGLQLGVSHRSPEYDVEASLLLAEPKDLTLTAPAVSATATRCGDDVEVTLQADRLALSVMLWLDGIDATWSDNFFHLLPAEPRRVVCTRRCSSPPTRWAPVPGGERCGGIG